MDGQGFPYLADYVYLAGFMDKAISCVKMEDAGERVQFILEQACFCLWKLEKLQLRGERRRICPMAVAFLSKMNNNIIDI